ncbi:hypothetical protein MtrunA17_Chr6g0456791 [Medicago truncatula]|uniref:Uncharacterized protein n=1 Tax=Medicago truncatula TaxID=3880 RepID=A0A396HCW2_MEDTR|nr:hypothetical protein MtrunA17_Chr6g0456791 [Medicago truncatula]
MESGCDLSLVNNASYDQLINKMIPSKGLQASQISVGINSMLTLEEDVIIIDDDDDDDEEEKDLERHGITDNNNSMEMDNRANSNMHVPIPIEVAHKVSELKYDQEKHSKSSNGINVVVSLIDSFTRDQIKQHITSMRKKYFQVITPPSGVFNYLDTWMLYMHVIVKL